MKKVFKELKLVAKEFGRDSKRTLHLRAWHFWVASLYYALTVVCLLLYSAHEQYKIQDRLVWEHKVTAKKALEKTSDFLYAHRHKTSDGTIFINTPNSDTIKELQAK